MAKRSDALGRATAFATLLLFATSVHAQSWPQRNVTMVVSQAAGASPDVMARLLADRMSKSMGVGVVVENKPGGANVTGALAVARAESDGHTVFFATTAALVANPFLIKALPYDPIKSFAPVAYIARSDQMIVVNPDVKATTLAQLIDLDRREPGKISIGVDSPRSLAGITAQALNHRAGVSFVLVPYPNIATAIQDVMTGRIQSAVLSTSIAEAHIRQGAIRALATASARRSQILPDVPPVAETWPGFDFSGWFMLVAPAGTPSAIVMRLNAEIAAAVTDKNLQEIGRKLGFEIAVGSVEASSAFLKQQLAQWEKVTKDLGLGAL